MAVSRHISICSTLNSFIGREEADHHDFCLGQRGEQIAADVEELQVAEIDASVTGVIRQVAEIDAIVNEVKRERVNGYKKSDIKNVDRLKEILVELHKKFIMTLPIIIANMYIRLAYMLFFQGGGAKKHIAGILNALQRQCLH